MSDRVPLADRVRKARKQQRLSQQELAERAGVTLGVIGNLERGKTKPTPVNQRQILDALGLEPADSDDDDRPEETRSWSRDIAVWLDVMGLFFESLDADQREPIMHNLAVQAMRERGRLGTEKRDGDGA